MTWLKMLSYYYLVAIVATSRYKSESEYDFDFYEDLPTDYSARLAKDYTGTAQNSYYVMEAFDNKETQRDPYFGSNDYPISLGDSATGDPSSRQFDWYKVPDKVYRYTKHRIPGYDYDEFDYVYSKRFQECDDRSVWTHCLCQFTCSEPDAVDCYTPCESGCECKEEYVFDEKTQRCLLPEHCSSDDYDYRI